MAPGSSSRLIGGLAAFILLAVAWDAFAPRHGAPAPPAAGDVAPPSPDSGRPRPSAAFRSQSSGASQGGGTTRDSSGASYLEQLARSETRRRIRASAGVTYLNEIVAESQDSG